MYCCAKVELEIFSIACAKEQWKIIEGLSYSCCLNIAIIFCSSSDWIANTCVSVKGLGKYVSSMCIMHLCGEDAVLREGIR